MGELSEEELKEIEREAELFSCYMKPSRETLRKMKEDEKKERREKIMLWLQLAATVLAALSLLVTLLLR